jgi:hypothetical protein
MHKVLLVAVSACVLAGCTAREQQVLTAGAVGAVAGAVIVNELNSPPRPVYVQQPYQQYYAPMPPRRPRCFTTWERTAYGTVERQVCGRY